MILLVIEIMILLVIGKMSYDRSFIQNVLDLLDQHHGELQTFPESFQGWYTYIHDACETFLERFTNRPHWREYKNTMEGEVVSLWIHQYRYDEDFQSELMDRLWELAEQRDDVISKHNPHPHH